MSKKFTEEQYQKIINIYELQSDYVDAIRLVLDYIDGLNWLGYEEAIAIANPITREWAHDKFVEKDKSYVWFSKKENGKKSKLMLFRHKSGIVASFVVNNAKAYLDDGCLAELKLTESEIMRWGYNPEMFDREEV